MAAGDLFKRAARYRKSHPGMSMPEALKACSKSSAKGGSAKSGRKKAAHKKKAAVSGHRRHKKAAKKKAARKAPAVSRKVKIKVKKTKGGQVNLGISGVSLSKVSSELQHQASLHNALKRHQEMLRQKGLTPGEKAQIRRDIKHYRSAITASKRHVTALKRSI